MHTWSERVLLKFKRFFKLHIRYWLLSNPEQNEMVKGLDSSHQSIFKHLWSPRLRVDYDIPVFQHRSRYLSIYQYQYLCWVVIIAQCSWPTFIHVYGENTSRSSGRYWLDGSLVKLSLRLSAWGRKTAILFPEILQNSQLPLQAMQMQ